MGSCPVARVTRVLLKAAKAFEAHARDCGDRVVAIALHPDDHDELSIAEMWGLPVLAADDVPKGTLRLLCEANGVVIPDVHTVEDLLERWTYHLQRPAA